MKSMRQFVIYIMIIFSATPLCAQVNLDAGLIGHWPLDGTANDISGNNRNGQVIGNLTAAPDRFGRAEKAFAFDGMGSYIRVTDNGELNPDKFSISVWFQTSADRVQTIIGKTKFNQNPQNEQLQLYINWPQTPGIGSVLVPQGAPCNLGHLFAESRLATGTTLCQQRWYHLVVSFDGVDHKLYLDGKLKASRKTNFDKITACLGDYQFGSWWSGDLQYFEGLMDDIRIYNRALNDEEVAVLGGQQTETDRYDFSYLQNICNPLEVSFFYNGPGSKVSWKFENDEIGVGKRPVHLFSKNDQFQVTMIVEYSNCITNDTLIKNVNLRFNPANLIYNSDTVICRGSSFQIKASIPNEFCWMENEFLSDNTIADPVVKADRDTVFYLNHKRQGINLVTNGDFSAGNTGFTSTYLYRSNNTTEGEYFVSPFPRNWNGALSTCVQPNGLSGNMMLVNGVPEPNKVVWEQEITVEANKTYDFSLYITALFPVNPALLQFAINGIIVGDSIAASPVPCTWRKFNVTWNSASSTKAIISVVNRNTEIQGNDFAMDDIAFREIIYETDSIQVKVETGKMEITKDTAICKNKSLQLLAMGAVTYSWSPAFGLNNANINNPIAVVDTNIVYTVTGQTVSGCVLEGEVKIASLELPVGRIIPDQISVCGKDSIQLLAEGGTQYLWQPGSYFNDSTIVNPKAEVDTTITLTVQITAANGCSVMDFIKVEWKSNSSFDLTPRSASICPGDSIELFASGGNEYNWESSPLINNPDKPRVIVRPTTDTEFKVKIKNTSCGDSATLSSIITMNPLPGYEITKSNDLDCYTPSARLLVTGGSSYRWEPANTLNNPNIPDPIANPREPTTYNLFVTSDKGCVAQDSIFLDFTNNGVLNISGDTSTCMGVQIQLTAEGASTYSWFPQTGLNNPLIANPIATIDKDIKYIVSGVTVSGCQLEDSISINTKESPVITISPGNPIKCGNDTLQLLAQGGILYQWSPATNLSNPNIANPIATVQAPVTYAVKVTNEIGCFAVDSISIRLRDAPEFEINPRNGLVCKGDTIRISATGGDKFIWQPAPGLTNLAGQSITVRPAEDMVYQVKITNSECNDSAVLTSSISIQPPPQVNVSKSGDLNCDVATIQLFATGGVSYSWDPSIGLSNPNVANPSVSISSSTMYHVTVRDSIGCMASDTITVQFINTGNLTLYQLPTAFTPNGDGLNDCFGINKWGSGVQIEQFLIFNRWGHQVFAGNASGSCWDGRFKGQMQPSGNYIYLLKASTNCGIIERKGAFLLIR